MEVQQTILEEDEWEAGLEASAKVFLFLKPHDSGWQGGHLTSMGKVWVNVKLSFILFSVLQVALACTIQM